MSTNYIVEQGDCLSSIAYHYGFRDWHTIYDHPNNAAFKTKRPNPNLIYPGDEIFIPDFVVRDDGCQTDMNHRFQLNSNPTYLNVRIQDLAGNAIKTARYRLTIDKQGFRGKTDNDGWIKREIPPAALFGTLKVWPNPKDSSEFSSWDLNLGYLDPLETTSGIKARLNNLGYDCGKVDSEQNDMYDQAVRQFQEDHGLQVDGIVGPITRGKLKELHRV